MPSAHLSFLPWVRQGAAGAITTTDTLGANQSAVASVAAALSLNNAPVPGISVRLHGPADVVGVDANQVVRTDPRPGTTDFEPNYFASIEFDRADFPWLFTPARANANGQLRPWLCLVVVQQQPGVTLTTSPDARVSVLEIGGSARPSVELPDLNDSWAWAHAQVAAEVDQVGAALNGAPALSLSRLVSPRILAPNTDYLACVVPTVELGRKAGLGLDVAESDLTAANALAPAWSLGPAAPEQVRLPVYYHWEFRTGQAGDFDSLARALTPRVPAGLGRRTIDVSHPGFPAAGATTVEMQGALLPIPPAHTPPPVPPPPAVPPPFQTTLAGIINEPDRQHAADPNADPLLAPPIYGRWHAGRATVAPGSATWLDQLNLDPPWRVVAGVGTRVVQEHQEALMASAWEQAAELPNANQRLRQLQLSMTVGESLHERHLSRLSEETLLRVAAPAFGRLRQAPGRSLLAAQAASPLPLGANRAAMRRIGRARGPLSRRLAAQGVARSSDQTWVSKLMAAPTTAATAPAGAPMVDYCPLPQLPTDHLGPGSYFGAFFVAAENAPVAAPGVPVRDPARTEIPGYFRAAARVHHDRFLTPHAAPSAPAPIPLQAVKQVVLDQMQPRAALPLLVAAILSTGDNVLAPTAPGVTPLGIETVLMTPAFPQPMYEPLRDLSQELLLPGLGSVPQDSVVGLGTNRPFVEAYMVGLNHEMGRELLWRGFPTDQRGTSFAHFWGLGVPNAAPADIADLNTWGKQSLGHSPGAPGAEQFVMLLRGRLLRRYPNAVIYLTPAIRTQTPDGRMVVAPSELAQDERLPIFNGSMPPDVSFFGFPITTQTATGGDGGLGYYVVIQEHPTEPRFGLDVSISLGNASYLPIAAQPPAGLALNGRTWGKNAAEMAGITRRLPVRVAIHASRLMASA